MSLNTKSDLANNATFRNRVMSAVTFEAVFQTTDPQQPLNLRAAKRLNLAMQALQFPTSVMDKFAWMIASVDEVDEAGSRVHDQIIQFHATTFWDRAAGVFPGDEDIPFSGNM